jgi:uncharacterized membrane protein
MHSSHGWGKKVACIAGVVIVALVAFGWSVMQLWNWLMPPLFGLTMITFWQALGLLVLGRLLFGGFRGFGRHRRNHHRMHERWQRMTPEQRESFSRGLRRGCRWHRGSDDAAESNSKAL